MIVARISQSIPRTIKSMKLNPSSSFIFFLASVARPTLPVKLRSEKVIIPNWQPIEVGNLEFLLHMLLSSSPAALFYTGYDCEEAGSSSSRSSADVVVVSALWGVDHPVANAGRAGPERVLVVATQDPNVVDDLLSWVEECCEPCIKSKNSPVVKNPEFRSKVYQNKLKLRKKTRETELTNWKISWRFLQCQNSKQTLWN